MKELPKLWCVEITKENAPLLEKFFKENGGKGAGGRSSMYIGHLFYWGQEYISGYVYDRKAEKCQEMLPHTEITTEDFKVHVLKQLPNKWYVERTPETYTFINKWATANCPKNYSYQYKGDLIHSHPVDGSSSCLLSGCATKGFTEISFDLFMEKVYMPYFYPEGGTETVNFKDKVVVYGHCPASGTFPVVGCAPISMIYIPQNLLKEGQDSLTSGQREFIVKHYDPFSGSMAQDRVKEFYNMIPSSCSWKQRLEKEFAFLKKDWKDEVTRGGYYPESYLSPHREKSHRTFYMETAKRLGAKMELMIEMTKFAELRNEGSESLSYYLTSKGCVSASGTLGHNHIGVFGISFKTADIAKEAAEIFGDRIKSCY